MTRKNSFKHDKEVNACKREIGYRFFMVLVASVALVSVCAAWFANNQRVNANSVSVQPSIDGFELAAEGALGKNDSLLAVGYATGNSGTFATYEGKVKTGYVTSGSLSSINWAVDENSNINNIEAAGEGILPGSSGSITFYIIPNSDGDMTINLTFSLQGIIDNEDKTGHVEAGETAQSLLNYHLLLFAEKDTNSYKYWISSDADNWSKTYDYNAVLSRLADGKMVWEGKNLEKNKAYPVTVYWIWPELFGQYIFADSISNQPVLFPDGSLPANLFGNIVKTDDFDSANGYLMWSESGSGTTEKEEFKNVADSNALTALRNGTGNMSLYRKISIYYNKADQYIGENIRYVRLQVDAE